MPREISASGNVRCVRGLAYKTVCKARCQLQCKRMHFFSAAGVILPVSFDHVFFMCYIFQGDFYA